ncbi:zinc finger protein 516-like [Brachionichthys hirsutus]|uniref:zinc finger protein 516-like n=1 Tax=Brachionichthys hirsutus TaxID=412623 RepID=UPI0036049E83
METEEREDASPNPTAEDKAETNEVATSGHACGICGRSFPLLSSLSQHMRRHTREKPYKCPYCDHSSAQKGSLKAHIRSHKLGLFGHNLRDMDGDQGQKDIPETPDPAEMVSVPQKSHAVNGKVKKKGTKKKVKGTEGVEDGDEADGVTCTCCICGQVFPQVLLLKSHMKKHRSSQDYGCRICGRRFRQAWFLQSHMRIHKAQLRGGKSNEPPTTINGVPQDPASLINEECLYERCAGCGNFFSDCKTLRMHEKLHKLNHGRNQTQKTWQEEIEISDMDAAKRDFLEGLDLKCVALGETSQAKSLGRGIPGLDPVCSYQAWQLATRGRLVEATEKGLGWEERLADAEVTYDTEKGEYVPLKQEKKRKPIDSASSNGKKIKGAQTKGGDKSIYKKDRILLNGLGHAFYQVMQTKTAKDVRLTVEQVNSMRSKDKEDKKTRFSDDCDFQAGDTSVFGSDPLVQNQDVLGSHGNHSTVLANVSQSGSKVSRYMDYLRSRSVMLSQPYWNPYTCLPSHGSTEPNVKCTDVKGQGQKSNDAGGLLNLSSWATSGGDATGNDLVQTEGLVTHQCPYCAHTSSYPEVLWIHQRVAHRVDSSSSVVPKWAPCINNPKSLRSNVTQWRRTGPPPFLEGTDCPALPAPRSQRTLPPGSTTHMGRKRSAPKTKSGVPKSKHQPNEFRSDGKQASETMGFLPQNKFGDNKQAKEGGSKSSSNQATPSRSIVPRKSTPRYRVAIQPKPRAHRSAGEANFPPEGLGFMLSRKHGDASSNATADGLQPRRQSWDSSSSPAGPGLWATTNMWDHKSYFGPLRFSQGKNEPTGERPMDVNILSLLKNYSPHELYRHWGFVDPRMDPQALLQFNGHYGKEASAASEPSKQVNSRSGSSSGSVHKGT